MRTVVCGSRWIRDPREVEEAMRVAAEEDGIVPTVVLSGTAPGADRLGERWAGERGVPVERRPADWDRHGRAAGPIRNEEMVREADALVAVWDGRSRGTKNMIGAGRGRGLTVHVHLV